MGTQEKNTMALGQFNSQDIFNDITLNFKYHDWWLSITIQLPRYTAYFIDKLL